MEDALKKAWQIATSGQHGLSLRKVDARKLTVPQKLPKLPPANAATEAARKAIFNCIKASCGTTLAQALEVQAKHSAGFMLTRECNRGVVGSNAKKMLDV